MIILKKLNSYHSLQIPPYFATLSLRFPPLRFKMPTTIAKKYMHQNTKKHTLRKLVITKGYIATQLDECEDILKNNRGCQTYYSHKFNEFYTFYITLTDNIERIVSNK